MDSEISIEETNKIRAALGLKPLKVEAAPKPGESPSKSAEDAPDATTTEGRERIAVENWKKLEEERNKEAARKARAAEIKKARDAAARFRKLEGVGLGDADDKEEDTTTWVKKMKKRQKKAAELLAKEKEEELERAARGHQEYTAENLKGLKVGHDLGDLDEAGGETILTLKDATIDENEAEGDELISTELAERERLQERLELKKKKPVYNAYDEANGEAKGILSQYDDELGEKAKKRFVLAGTGTAGSETYRQQVAEKLKQAAFSLDVPKPEVASDYVDPSTMKIRKPKKKKKSTRKRDNDDEDALAPQPAATADDGPDAMEVDEGTTVAPKPKRVLSETSFVDDDDLQASLALQRRSALKRRKILKPADIARQLRDESNGIETPGVTSTPGEEEEPAGLVIDETSEFVATLRAPVLEPRRAAPAPAPVVAGEASPEIDGDADVDMTREERAGTHSPATPFTPATPGGTAPEISSTGLEAETTISRGVGATLAMLHQRGLIQRDAEAEQKIQLQRERERFRAEKRRRELEAEERARAARLKDRQSGKFERMSAREREEHARWENKNRDLQVARDLHQRFKDYKPDVSLSYKDEFGREMNKKEAFKYLSHQFHGKGSGKAKTEKRLKKIEDEKKREAASSLNTTATDIAVQSAAKKTKQAGVRLM